jgi:peroxiredoxin
MSLTIGQKAPDFTLFDTEKQPKTLSNLEGKNVLLLFFPLAFTSVCTAELCNIRDNIATYSNVNAEVFGISVDSVFALGKFKEEQQLNFSLLSDFNKEASTAYDVIYDTFPAFGMKGVSKRAAFIVDKSGNIAYTEICATPGDMPNFAAINETLAKLG